MQRSVKLPEEYAKRSATRSITNLQINFGHRITQTVPENEEEEKPTLNLSQS